MGAERWIDFGAEDERVRVIAYLGDLWKTDISHCDGKSVARVWIDPLDIGYSDGMGESPCFGVQIGYSFGGNQSSDLAMLVCRELARRFNATRIGADSVGWYDDSGWVSSDPGYPTDRYGSFASWAEWAKAWKPEWSSDVHRSEDEDALAFAQSLEKFVVGLFKSLDAHARDRAVNDITSSLHRLVTEANKAEAELYSGASNALADALEAARACELACSMGDLPRALGRYGAAWEHRGRAAACLERLGSLDRSAVEETTVNRLDLAGFAPLMKRCGEWIANGGGAWT